MVSDNGKCHSCEGEFVWEAECALCEEPICDNCCDQDDTAYCFECMENEDDV